MIFFEEVRLVAELWPVATAGMWREAEDSRVQGARGRQPVRTEKRGWFLNSEIRSTVL